MLDNFGDSAVGTALYFFIDHVAQGRLGPERRDVRHLAQIQGAPDRNTLSAARDFPSSSITDPLRRMKPPEPKMHKELIIAGQEIFPGNDARSHSRLKLYDFTDMKIPVAVMRGTQDGPNAVCFSRHSRR